jgi:capsular polysaccharide biosynthesis protein
LATLAGLELGSSGSTIEEGLAVLRSREFTETFIREEGLLPVLFEARRSGKEPTLAKAYRFFDRDVRAVMRDTRSGLVTVQVEWRDPVLAAEWANKLVQRLNAEMRARAIAKTNAAVGFLEKELIATTIVDTRSAISRLMEAQINQRMLANVTEEYALRVVDRALPPDDDDPVRPRRLFLAVVSGAVGLLMAVLLCVMLRRPA